MNQEDLPYHRLSICQIVRVAPSLRRKEIRHHQAQEYHPGSPQSDLQTQRIHLFMGLESSLH